MNQDVERSKKDPENERLAIGVSVPRVLVAVLAAGASRRLGRPKQLVTLGGESLLRRQCRTAIASGVGDVVAILGFHSEDCKAEIADLPVACRMNSGWIEGVASSIREAVGAAEEVRADGLMLALVDQYQLTSSDLVSLFVEWSNRPSTACVAAFGNEIGPPVIFSERFFEKLKALEGDVGARRLLETLPSQEVRQIRIDRARIDLDEPAQLAELASAATLLSTEV